MSDEDQDFKYDDDAEDENHIADGIPKDQRVLRTQAYDKSINDIISMIKDGDIMLDPEYQRNYVWDNKKASLLVESILLNVPIPVIYVAEEEDGVWTVVDGLQRFNSLDRFFKNEFKLKGLEVLSEFNGLQFSTLNPKAARLIKNGILRVIVILKESHPEIKYDIFMRLNRGAIKLNEQELRNCLYRGKLNNLVMQLRENKKFLQMIGLSKPHLRMADAELILRYFTLSQSYDQNTGKVVGYAGSVKNALNKYCEDNKHIKDEDTNSLSTLFTRTIDTVYEVLGASAFQRIYEGDYTDGRLNRAVMDCIMLSFENKDPQILLAKKSEIKALLKNLPNEDADFNEAITYGTGDKKRLETRLNTWNEKLNALL